MALFGRKKNKGLLPEPIDPRWVHGEGGRFPRFLDLDPEAAGLKNSQGVFAIWHTGLRPAWVYIGWSTDLAQDFFRLGDDPRILEHRNKGNLYCSWSPIRKEFHKGVCAYLTTVLRPIVENPEVPDARYVELVPVLPPGMTKEQLEALAPPESERKPVFII